jgi:hypothetical protein
MAAIIKANSYKMKLVDLEIITGLMANHILATG